MADRIKKIKIKQADGNFSDYIPIGAEAENIDFKSGYNLEKTVGTINPDEEGSIATQLGKLRHNEQTFDPEDYKGSELEKLQAATDAACDYIKNNDETACVLLNKVYEFGVNDTLVINRGNQQSLLRFNGINGGGFLLKENKTKEGINVITLADGISYANNIEFLGVSFYGKNYTGVLLHSPTFLNVYFNNCSFVK